MTWMAFAVAACLGYGSLSGSVSPQCLTGPVQPRQPIFQDDLNHAQVDRLQRLARVITVKVLAGMNRGSGILIHRQGQIYTVLTNQHVVTPGPPYLIQTPDGWAYPATLIKKVDFQGDDLQLLQFKSGQRYELARLGRTQAMKIGQPVVSAGFPIEPHPQATAGFLVSLGQVSLLPQKPLQRGYQLAYTNPIYQGMSGGPVLNVQGEVVGINSLHAYPLWGNPYIFKDGSQPLPQERAIVISSSWAVPVDTFICRALPSARSILPTSLKPSDFCVPPPTS